MNSKLLLLIRDHMWFLYCNFNCFKWPLTLKNLVLVLVQLPTFVFSIIWFDLLVIDLLFRGMNQHPYSPSIHHHLEPVMKLSTCLVIKANFTFWIPSKHFLTSFLGQSHLSQVKSSDFCQKFYEQILDSIFLKNSI